MIRDREYDDDGALEAVFDSSHADDEMELLASPNVSEEYLQRCIEHFENLSDELLDALCEALCRYCENVRDDAEDVFGDLGLPETITGREILNYCSPSALNVEAPPNENVIGYSVEGSCDWEPEHGIQVIIRDDRVLFVSSFEGRSVWDFEESYRDDRNYARTER